MVLWVHMFAGFFGMLAIVFGAFGAHKLKKTMSAELLQGFETGVKYQMYHAIVLLVLGFNLTFKTSLEKGIAYCFIFGTILFSFSIYGLTISAMKGAKIKFLGPVTPVGGLLLTVGWVLLIYYFYNRLS